VSKKFKSQANWMKFLKLINDNALYP